jgi:hypothetical protein
MVNRPVSPGSPRSRLRRVDALLLSVRWPVRTVVLMLTVGLMIWQALPQVPREYIDYSRIGILSRIAQPTHFGSDTMGDAYEAKVVLNAPSDMYTKTRLEQTAAEAAVWTKRESAPYPPAMLLAEAALYRVGELTGLRFYGVILLLAFSFVGLSLMYFVRTRWYVFPLLYANFAYLAYRMIYVQDCSYLVMLNVVVVALMLARSRTAVAHTLMAVAITMKLTPLWFAKDVVLMPRRQAWTFAVIVAAGLVLPFFIWSNYLSAIRFHETVKGDWLGVLAAVVYVPPFATALWYADAKLGFDWEDRIGWSMVPLGMFLAMYMNVPRHLLMALLVPDRRAARNIVAAIALALPTFWPQVFRYGTMLSIATVLLFAIVISYLHRIGWDIVREDVRHPIRTLTWLLVPSPSESARRTSMAFPG